MTKRTTGPGIFGDQDEIVNAILGLTPMKPEAARKQLDQKELKCSLLATVGVIALWALLWFVFAIPYDSLIIWAFCGAAIAFVAFFSVNSYIEHRYTTGIKTEREVIWRRYLIAMRAQSRINGSYGDVFILGFGRCDDETSKAGYRYLYDNGFNIEMSEIPGKSTKIYLELDDDASPYIICWRGRCYRESLLANPSARLPYLDEYESWGDPDVKHYDVFLPKDSNIGVFEMV